MTVHLNVTVRLVNVRLCAAEGQLLRLLRMKLAMLRAFTVGFLEILNSCLLFLVTLPGLTDTLAQLLTSIMVKACETNVRFHV